MQSLVHRIWEAKMPRFYPIYLDGKEVNPKRNISSFIYLTKLAKKIKGEYYDVKEINV
jgi:hypothetical protein